MSEADILHWFESLHGSILDPAMAAVSLSATSGIIWFIIGILLAWKARDLKPGAKVIFAVLLAYAIVDVALKPIICRERPFNVLDLDVIGSAPTSWSFPSGHTASAFAGAISLLLIDRRIGIPFVVYACFIGISRMYLCVHWPTDVLAGAIIGTLAAVAVMLVIDRAGGRHASEG